MHDRARYLDTITEVSGLPRTEAERLRTEMADHLDGLIRAHVERGLCEGDAIRRAIREFGEPALLAAAWREARVPYSPAARYILPAFKAAVFFLLAGWAANVGAYEVYKVAGRSLEPAIRQGTHVIVVKRAETVRAGDVVVYRDGERSYLAVADGWLDGKSLSAHRNGRSGLAITREEIVGRVVCLLP